MLKAQLQSKWKRQAAVLVAPSKKRRMNRLSKIASIGKQLSKPEIKCVDINAGGSPPVVNLVSSTPTITLLNDLVVGAGTNQRIGRNINMKSIHVRGAMFPSTNAGFTAGEYTRVVLVYDRQANGAAPTYANIFTSTDNGGNNSSTTPFDFPNVANSERFVILADLHFQWNNLQGTSVANIPQSYNLQDASQSSKVDRFVSLKDIPVSYIGAGGAGAASLATGALYLITVGLQAAATAGSTFNWTSRLRYSDN